MVVVGYAAAATAAADVVGGEASVAAVRGAAVVALGAVHHARAAEGLAVSHSAALARHALEGLGAVAAGCAAALARRQGGCHLL